MRKLLNIVGSDGNHPNNTNNNNKNNKSNKNDDQQQNRNNNNPSEEIREAIIENKKRIEQENSNNNANNNMTTGDDFILASLVESGFITGSIKTVYERGKQESFYQNLENFLEKQKIQIETICSTNYEEFLKSVSQLKHVRNDAKLLKQKIISLNQQVQEAGEEALKCGKILLTYHYIQQNIYNALQLMENCKQVTNLTIKIHLLINDKKYFSALKTIDYLEKNLRILSKFPFILFLEKQIPIFKKKIKNDVERDFNQWLVNVRNKSQLIGKEMIKKQFNLMKRFNNLITLDKFINYSASELLDFYYNSNTSTNKENNKLDNNEISNDLLLGNPTIDRIDNSITIFDILENLNVELTPVYTCKHIYETMDSFEQFKGYYKRNRNIQLNHEMNHTPPIDNNTLISNFNTLATSSGSTAINSGTTTTTDNNSNNRKSILIDSTIYPTTVEEWLERIIGFFTVEHITLLTTSSLLSNIELNSMWENSLQKIITIIDEHLAIRMNQPKEYLKLKKIVLLFSLTISEQLELHTSLLIDLLAHYRTAFASAIESTAINNVENSDCRISMGSLNQLDNLKVKQLRKFNLLNNNSSINSNNNEIVFSITILTCCIEMERFILDYEMYCDRIVSYTTSIKQLKEGMIKIFESVIRCFDKELHSSTGTGISRYVQIVINYQYMIDCVIPYFEEMYSKRVKSNQLVDKLSPSNNNSVMTSNKEEKKEEEEIKYFKQIEIIMGQCRDRGEDMILKEVLNKCNKAISLSTTVSWTPDYQSTGVLGNIINIDNIKSNITNITNNITNNNNLQNNNSQIQAMNEPHSFIIDLINYLENINLNIQFIRQEKKEQILFSACDLIARSLQDILTNNKIVNEITMKGIYPIFFDLQQLIKFTNQLKSCTFCFIELNCVITFLLNSKFSEDLLVNYDEENKVIVETDYEKVVIEKFEQLDELNREKSGLLRKVLLKLKNSRIEYLKRVYKKPKLGDIKNLFKIN
ncbi:hypothetical protein ABK040_010476 [Willaertia magna]